jgi:hypothetical protein
MPSAGGFVCCKLLGMVEDRDRDWVGTWFELAAERGESAEIPFGTVSAADASVAWRSFAHRDVDGIAAMGDLVGVAELPVAAASSREKPARPLPSPFMRKPSARWRTLDVTKLGAPSGRGHRLLSIESTQRIRDAAKAAGVSVNSLLAWALARAVEDELDRNVGPILFEMPVNLRGAPSLAELPPRGNVFATITADFGLPSAAAVHAAVQTALGRGEHWSSWNGLNVGREQGIDFVRNAASNAAAGTGFRVGVFSNLGSWERSEPSPAGIVFAPPPAQRTPLAAGAVTWNGRLGLMMIAHANLAEAAPRLDAWLDRWVDAALAAPGAPA